MKHFFIFFIGFLLSIDAISQDIRFPSTVSPREVIAKLFQVKWNAKTKVFDLPSAKRTDDAEYIVMDTVFRFKSKGIDHLLIIVYDGSEMNGCHGCSVSVSQIQLKKTTDGKYWLVDFFKKGSFTSGSWGEPGDFSLLKIDDANHLLVDDGYFMGQGYSTSTNNIYFREKLVLEITSGESNAGAVEEESEIFSYESKLIAYEALGMLAVLTTGTKLDENGKVVDAKEVVKYIFKNGKFTKL